MHPQPKLDNDLQGTTVDRQLR